MKKKMVSLFVALIMIVTNTSMAYALSPVAEVYYSFGTSKYDSSQYESALNDAIKAKLVAAGVNPKYFSIMDANANPASVTDVTYVHSGYDSWYNGSIPEVETADYNHVQIGNNGKSVTFYGYTAPAYKDFMLTDANPTGKKIITFDMDESKVNYHSMEGGGFLFNSKISSEGKLSGYVILYVEGSIKIYKLDGLDATKFHNESGNPLSSMSGPGVTLIGTYAKGASTQHSIKINATDTKLNMWDNGVQIIKDLALTTVYGDEFGPFVSYKSHGCGIISIFAFDNMKLFTTSDKKLDTAVEEIYWEPNSPVRYVINVNDDNDEYWTDDTKKTSLTDTLNNNGTQYIGVTSVTGATYEKEKEFVDNLLKGGLILDKDKQGADIIDAIASRIADQIINGYKDAILAIETAESKTDIQFDSGDTKTSVKKDITLQQDDKVTTVWSSDQPSIIAADGTVTRPVTTQKGIYVNLKATITEGELTSEKIFTVFVAAADPAPLTTLSAVEGDKQITLNFPALGQTSSIIVEQSTDGTTFTPATTAETLDKDSTSATVTGLTNGTTYYFRIFVGSGFYAGLSNVVTVKPIATVIPVTPSDEQPTMNTKVTVSDPSNGGKVVQDKITKIIGEDLKVSGKIKSANGQELNVPAIVMNADGSFTLPKVAPGEYKLSLNVTAPNGEKLAGPVGKLIVDSQGNATLSVDLIDPYGTIVDTITKQPIAGVNMQLYWADTELNRSKGRTPGTLVNLPELPNFAPNKNHNPQISSASGEYGWMVYADGDYYFLGEKAGYIVFDSRNDKRNEKFGDDSYIKDGIIHVGESIVQFSFSHQPKVKAIGDHSPYMVGLPNGAFQPERGITRAEVAAILSRLYTPVKKAKNVSYVDVKASNWAYGAIASATQSQWMIGNGKDMFQPNKQVTRAEFAQTLLNVYKWNVVHESTFTDVQKHWANDAIATVEKQGVLFDFTETAFNPNQAITRLEVVRIFNKLLERQPWHVSIKPKWSDVGEDHKYYTDIMEASIQHPFENFETGIENWK
ncbi:S-layer homology domain-containing protein [Cohnella abietis]|uniref:SLH domain-containing protein n=1 Tax=Cohnella abietis TaxID=2507935 RepID=A0A3T1CZG4_9BACL|nr:S-layer homology domain-containing protein [Cohnella abietis]BBI31224.1 hypothetical protein KCTCHS21_06230 [Cohnella abietis]